MMLVDDGVLINDALSGRLSLWSRRGEHLADHSHERRFRPRVVFGDRSTLVAAYAEEPADDYALNVTARFALTGDEIARISQVPIRGRVRILAGPTISSDFAEGYNQLDIELNGEIQPRLG